MGKTSLRLMQMLRFLLVIPVLIYCADVSAKESDPEAFVRWIYTEGQAGNAGDEGADASLPMTERLGYLFAQEEAYATSENGGLGRLDFDWMVNGQDANIHMLDIESEDVVLLLPHERPRKIVTARFHNFDSPTEIRYYWINHAERGWLLDDAVGSSAGEQGWTLSLLLAFGR